MFTAWQMCAVVVTWAASVVAVVWRMSAANERAVSVVTTRARRPKSPADAGTIYDLNGGAR